MVEVLIAAGIKVDDRDGGRWTPLHRASQSVNLDVIGALLEHRADPNAATDEGETPLHIVVARTSNAKVPEQKIDAAAELLISAGADIDPPDGYGRSPVHRAAYFGHESLVQRLVGAGADPRRRDMDGKNALHLGGRHREITSWLRSWASHRGVGWLAKITTQDLSAAPLQRLRVHRGTRRAIAIMDPYTLAAWTATDAPQLSWITTGEGSRITDCAFVGDGSTIAVAWRYGPLELRSWDDPDTAISVNGAEEPTAAIATDTNGRFLAVSAGVESVHVLLLSTAERTSTVEGGERTHSMEIAPDGTRLAVAKSYQGGSAVDVHAIDQNGQTTMVHSIERSNYYLTPSPFIDTIGCVRFSPDGRSLAIWETSAIVIDDRSGWRGKVALFAADDGTLRWQTTIDASVTGNKTSLRDAGFAMGYFTELAFSTDGTRLAVGIDGLFLELDTVAGAVVRRHRVKGAITSVATGAPSVWHLAGTKGHRASHGTRHHLTYQPDYIEAAG